jgi:hypothetical protein
LVPLALASGACSQKYARVQIFSEPLGAEVRTPKGEVLGLTPLTLEGDALKQASPDGKLMTVVVDAPGYVASHYTLEIRGKDKQEIKLRKVDEDAFREGVLFQYGSQVNRMVRELMSIQGMILVKKLAEAERALDEFHAKYPNIAASYVLSANVSIVRGELETAHGYLLKARSIDPSDMVVQQMLSQLTSFGARKYQSLTEEDQKALKEAAEQPAAGEPQNAAGQTPPEVDPSARNPAGGAQVAAPDAATGGAGGTGATGGADDGGGF